MNSKPHDWTDLERRSAARKHRRQFKQFRKQRLVGMRLRQAQILVSVEDAMPMSPWQMVKTIFSKGIGV